MECMAVVEGIGRGWDEVQARTVFVNRHAAPAVRRVIARSFSTKLSNNPEAVIRAGIQ